LLPRHLFFSAMFTVMLVLYPVLYPPDFSAHNIVAFIFGGFTVAIFWSETYRARSSRLRFPWVSLGRSRRSSSHIACRLVNSLGTLSRTRLVRGLFRHSSGRLVVCLRTGSLIGIVSLYRSVLGRFYRRLGGLGSAWSPVECFGVQT
jgi:hypothetical protein